MESKKKRYAIAGIFICVGIAIFIVTIFTLGGQRKTFSKKITLTAVFDDINGLQEGNNIWFAGVKIGTVKKIELKGSRQVQLILHVDEKVTPFIKKDASVKISSDGFIGNKIVVIYGGTDAASPVFDNDQLQSVKISSTEDMFTTLQANNKNLLEITSNFKEISQRIADGKGSVGSLLSSDQLANDLSAAISNFKKVSVAAKQTVNDISVFSGQLNKKGSSLHELVTDTIITNVLRNSIVQLRDASFTASEFINKLDAAALQLNDTSAPLGALLKDVNTAAQLKQIISNLESGSKKLDEDLEALQHNFLLRGYFRKKEKEK